MKLYDLLYSSYNRIKLLRAFYKHAQGDATIACFLSNFPDSAMILSGLPPGRARMRRLKGSKTGSRNEPVLFKGTALFSSSPIITMHYFVLSHILRMDAFTVCEAALEQTAEVPGRKQRRDNGTTNL